MLYLYITLGSCNISLNSFKCGRFPRISLSSTLMLLNNDPVHCFKTFHTSLNKVPIFKVLHIWVPNYFSSLIFHYSPKTTPCNKKIKSWYHLKMPYSFLVPSFQLCHLFTLDIPTFYEMAWLSQISTCQNSQRSSKWYLLQSPS